MEKIFDTALLVGRFQIIHAGHEDMIRKAEKLAERVLILIGSSNESGNEKNPFSYEERKRMMSLVFPKAETAPLPDIGVGNCAAWGEYVLDTCMKEFGTEPELFVSGNETRREDWFSSDRGENLARLFIPKTIDISATEMRKFLLGNEKENFLKFVSPSLYCEYDFMRDRILSVSGNCETKSI